MEWIAIVTALALIEYMWLGLRVGNARQKYEVLAPATTGHPIFERHYRVQMNTLEQLVVFLPALWLFGRYANAWLAALLGLVFIAGRGIYAFAYVADPASRSLGFGLTFLANVVLLLGALAGAVWALV
jgi:uncharacterized membrane protein YecN with MAPEG domain